MDGVPQVLDEILKQQKKSAQVYKRCKEVGATECSSEFRNVLKGFWVMALDCDYIEGVIMYRGIM